MSLSWLWDFGDGYTSELQNPLHKFTDEGDYAVTLTVTDDEDASDTFSSTITVTNPHPAETAVPVPLWVIMLVVAGLLGIVLLVVVFWNRRKR
jgi:PKD repeat protein